MTKTVCRFYTISDYLEEEAWLREEHNRGWKMTSFTIPCFYHFESCQPEDVIYRLDFKNNTQTSEYMDMCRDFGWEYFEKAVGWLYFRKPSSEALTKEDGELFSDNASKIEMLQRIVRYRMLPLLVIFLCAVLPNFTRILSNNNFSKGDVVFGIIYFVLFIIYMYLFIHCGTKLRKMKKRFENI